MKAEKTGRKSRRLWLSIGAAAVCIALAGGLAAMNLKPATAQAVRAEYPKMAVYPTEYSITFDNDYDKWYNSRKAQGYDVSVTDEGLWSFYENSTRQFLSGTQENRVYSPLNLYMALSMLAEITDGDSRKQIMELLSAEDLEGLRAQAGSLWNANYCDDGAITSILGNSLWLDSSIDYDRSVLERLAENYFASGYYGSFGTEAMNKELRSWLNDQTGGLLKDAAEQVELTDETVLALYSTLLFKGKWDNQFDKDNNDVNSFHSPNGDVEREFMNDTGITGYYWGEDFSAVYLSFATGCGMWLILPDRDKSLDDVLASGEYMELVKSGGAWENSTRLRVNYSVPKFDVCSTIGLTEGLEALGITNVFSSYTAEFCLLNGDNSGVFLGKAAHSARVKIDEEGCEAAAFTEMVACGASMPPDEEVNFLLDRPFLFVISGMNAQPLFTGTVYLP